MDLIRRNDGGLSNFFDFQNFFEKSLIKNHQPAINITESDSSFELELAAPGFSAEDLNAYVDDNSLVISGKMKKVGCENKGKYTFREFSQCSFNRYFTLPDGIDDQKVEAKYKDGILRITLPKKESYPKKKKMKEIEIT